MLLVGRWKEYPHRYSFHNWFPWLSDADNKWLLYIFPKNTRSDCDCSSNYGITDAVLYSTHLLQGLELPFTFTWAISLASVEFTTASSNKEVALKVKREGFQIVTLLTLFVLQMFIVSAASDCGRAYSCLAGSFPRSPTSPLLTKQLKWLSSFVPQPSPLFEKEGKLFGCFVHL